jgi:hypothetical protein
MSQRHPEVFYLVERLSSIVHAVAIDIQYSPSRGPLASSGSNRVNRGGRWNNDAANCLSAYRNTLQPANRFYNLGLRVALAPFEQSKPAAEPKSAGTQGASAEQRPEMP